MGRQERSMDRFEQEWRDAMEDANVSPPEIVWDRIDSKLANSEASSYRKKASFYKWVASVALLVAASLVTLEFIGQEEQEQASVTTAIEEPVQLPKDVVPTNELTSAQSTVEQNNVPEVTSTPINRPPASKPNTTNQYASAIIVDEDDNSLIERLLEFSFLERKEGVVGIDPTEKEYWVNRVPTYRNYVAYASKTPSRQDERFWAGVGVGSGVFDPNYNLNEPNQLTEAMLSDDKFVNTTDFRDQDESVTESITSGTSYSMGLNFGVKLSKRWTLESGVQYAVADLTSKTNVIIENDLFAQPVPNSSEIVDVPSIAGMTKQTSVVEYVNEDVDLENSFQFASVPLKAGYIVVDRKFNFKINAGIAADFYLGNKLKDTDNRVATLEITPGAESPYRDFSFSGLAGVEVGYRIADRLNLSIEPNYRHALQPATKQSSNFETTPSRFGVLAGLKYNFR